MSIEQREKQFWDEEWKKIGLRPVTGKLAIPTIDSVAGKRVLICSCGTGIEPVRAAKGGAATYAFDISAVAAANARRMAQHNGVKAEAVVMDFHNIAFPTGSFDVLYGSNVLHHIDCERAAREIYRVLKPGGLAYFRENSDRNPLLRFIRRRLFGVPGGVQKQRVLFVKRTGSTDEYPITEDEIEAMRDVFHGSLQVLNDRFLFFYLLDFLILRRPLTGKLLRRLDAWIGRAFPGLLKYSFSLQILLRKDQASELTDDAGRPAAYAPGRH